MDQLDLLKSGNAENSRGGKSYLKKRGPLRPRRACREKSPDIRKPPSSKEKGKRKYKHKGKIVQGTGKSIPLDLQISIVEACIEAKTRAIKDYHNVRKKIIEENKKEHPGLYAQIIHGWVKVSFLNKIANRICPF